MEFRPCSTTGAALATVATAKTTILARNIVDGEEMGLRSWIGIRSDGCYRKAFHPWNIEGIIKDYSSITKSTT